jgi:hypothetical protein
VTSEGKHASTAAEADDAGLGPGALGCLLVDHLRSADAADRIRPQIVIIRDGAGFAAHFGPYQDADHARVEIESQGLWESLGIAPETATWEFVPLFHV